MVDAHCDTISLILDDALAFCAGDARGQVDLPRLRSAHVGIQVFACWNEPAYSHHAAFARCMAKIGAYHQLARQEGLQLVRSRANLDEPGPRFILSLEDAAPCMGSVVHLEALFAAGVRMIGLTWNGRNELADGVGVGQHPGGLTEVGRALVSHMEQLGIVVDLAHVAEPSFWDTLDSLQGPAVVSHANARAVHDHRRNLSDAQIKALADRGGVVGITFVPAFLAQGRSSVNDVVRHIKHVAQVGGLHCVGLGSDFDGITETPEGLEHVGCLPNLTAALLADGFSESDLRLILRENWLRVFRTVWRD